MATRAELRLANARQAAEITLEMELAEMAHRLEVERDAQRAVAKLSRDQQEILRLLCNGLQNPEIAEHYRRHHSSVRKSTARICKKLGAKSIPEACYIAGIAGFT